ncbi:hypothetical protein D3C72_1065000 [compost metagenome]
MHLAVTQYGRFLINSWPAAAQHLFNERSPAHVAAPFFRKRIIVNRPAIRPLQHRVTRGRFGMLHHLLSLLAAAPGANADMNHIIPVEHFGWWQRIDRFQQLTDDAFRFFQRPMRQQHGKITAVVARQQRTGIAHNKGR